TGTTTSVAAVTASTTGATSSVAAVTASFTTAVFVAEFIPPAVFPSSVSYQAFAPPKKPVSLGERNQPPTIFITPSKSQTPPTQRRSGTNRKLGVRLLKCPPTKLRLWRMVKN